MRAAQLSRFSRAIRLPLVRRAAGYSTSSAPPPPPPPPDWRTLLQSIWTVARFGAVAYVVQGYVLTTTMSVGPSMLPTFATSGDVLLADFLSPRLSGLRAGDVVVAVKPTDPSVSILKRIRAMPDETVYVQPVSEPRPILLTIPPNHVWLEGDNRYQSTDSRHYGPVPICLVSAKVWARIWPASSAGLVRSNVVDHTAKDRARQPKSQVIDLPKSPP